MFWAIANKMADAVLGRRWISHAECGLGYAVLLWCKDLRQTRMDNSKFVGPLSALPKSCCLLVSANVMARGACGSLGPILNWFNNLNTFLLDGVAKSIFFILNRGRVSWSRPNPPTQVLVEYAPFLPPGARRIMLNDRWSTFSERA